MPLYRGWAGYWHNGRVRVAPGLVSRTTGSVGAAPVVTQRSRAVRES